MANEWLRLWHDMPTDPKWRTIARVSGQPIALVQAVYLHMLVDASRNVTRGHVTVTQEDLASALDVTDDQIYAILQAMHGRVLHGDELTGWTKRQPKREDNGNHETGAKSAAERKREQRKRDRLEQEVTGCHGADEACHELTRNVTTDKDKDTDKDLTQRETIVSLVANDVGSKVDKVPDCPQQQIVELFGELLPELPQPRAWEGQRANNLKARWRWVLTAKRPKSGERYATDAQTGIEFFRRMFGYVRESDFLMGRGKSGWLGCDLGWLVKAENFEKVLAGNYENREAAA